MSAIQEWHIGRAFDILGECEAAGVELILYPAKDHFYTLSSGPIEPRLNKLCAHHAPYLCEILRARQQTDKGHIRLVCINGRRI